MNIRERCEQFDRENPEVWRRFEAWTLWLIDRGHRKCGAKMIWERMRWEMKFETIGAGEIDGRELKLNNSFTSYYARKFTAKHPEWRKFFDLRRSRTAEPEQLVLVG